MLRSFGILLALLSKARRRRLVNLGSEVQTDHTITSLVVVPHRDLAYQFYHWIQSIISQSSRYSDVESESIVQVALRGASPIEEQIARLRSRPPHLLIGTPQALLEIYDKDKESLQIESLSTLVIDEVDHVIGLPSESTRKKYLPKAWKNFRKHPTAGRLLLNGIFTSRRPDAPSDIGPKSKNTRERLIEPDSSVPMQVVMASATVDRGLVDYLTEMHWLGSSNTRYAIIHGQDISKSKVKDSVSSAVTYHALVVARDGRILNVKDVLARPYIREDQDQHPKVAMKKVKSQSKASMKTDDGKLLS